MDLERFIKIQNAPHNGYAQALKEMQEGDKQNHWIWYIFPQLAGLGHSYMAQMYGIRGMTEAKAYLNHPILGQRLREITNVVLHYPTTANPNIFMMQPIDALKLKSCMTLFDALSPNDIFAEVLTKFFNGKRDAKTLQRLQHLK